MASTWRGRRRAVDERLFRSLPPLLAVVAAAAAAGLCRPVVGAPTACGFLAVAVGAVVSIFGNRKIMGAEGERFFFFNSLLFFYLQYKIFKN
jgi:hypothetical protein